MKTKIDKAIELAKNMNTLIDFSCLSVPLLDDFILVQRNLTDPNSKIIFVAVKNNTLEQFLAEGALKESESFNERLEQVLTDIKEESEKNPLYDGNDNYLIYLKNYDNKDFDFKIYAQDVLVGTKDDLKFIRQLSAFFLEPRNNEFYQIAMAAGQYVPSYKFKLLKDVKDLEKDEIIMGLEHNLKIIMDNITYRD